MTERQVREPSGRDRRKSQRWAEMFQEKPSGSNGKSLTRVVAGWFALVIGLSFGVMAVRGDLGSIGWPLALVAVGSMFATVIQAGLKALVSWLKSKPGTELVKNILSKVSPAASIDVVADVVGAVTKTTVTTEQSTKAQDLTGA